MALDFRLKTRGTLRQLIAAFNIFYASGHGIKNGTRDRKARIDKNTNPNSATLVYDATGEDTSNNPNNIQRNESNTQPKRQTGYPASGIITKAVSPMNYSGCSHRHFQAVQPLPQNLLAHREGSYHGSVRH